MNDMAPSMSTLAASSSSSSSWSSWSSSCLSYSPPRRVDPRTWRILQEHQCLDNQVVVESISKEEENYQRGYENRQREAEEEERRHSVQSPPLLLSSPFQSEDNRSRGGETFLSMGDEEVCGVIQSSLLSPQERLFLTHLFAVHRELVHDAASPVFPTSSVVFFSSPSTSPTTSSPPPRDDRLLDLYRLLRYEPWNLDGNYLRRLKSGTGEGSGYDGGSNGVGATWTLGQSLRAALFVAHWRQMEQIVRLYEMGERGDGGRQSSRAKPAVKTTRRHEENDVGVDLREGRSPPAAPSTSIHLPSPSVANIVLRDFNWTEQGFPLMEALGMEEAAVEFDRKVGTAKGIVERLGARGRRVWWTTMMEMGVEDEEIEEYEEEEEEEEERDDGSDRPSKTEQREEEEKRLLEMIRIEAKHHATVLHVLIAMSHLISS